MARKPRLEGSSKVYAKTEQSGWNLDASLYGYAEFKNKLKKASPEVRKQMDKEIRAMITPVSKLAKSYVPTRAMTNWRKSDNPKNDDGWGARKGWDKSEVVKGISVRQGGRRARGNATSSAWKIQNSSAAGAIYELAGKGTGNGSLASDSFISAINANTGRPSRLIWRAWDVTGGERELNRNIAEAVKRYERFVK